MVLAACQQKPEVIAVDIEAEKAALNVITEKVNTAFRAHDVATLTSLLTEDLICCGTDPSEFWNKQQITEMWTQMFADTAMELNSISGRVVKVSADGKSAIVVDQYMLPSITPKIPWRNVYHLVKTEDTWMINFISSAFIAKNEDVPKLNMALE